MSAPPASGKSLGDRIARPLKQAERERKERWEREQKPDLEALKAIREGKLKAARGANPKPEQELDEKAQKALQREIRDIERQLEWCPALTAGDDTSAALAKKLQNVTDETLFVFSSEGGDTVQTMLGRFQNSGTDCGLWLKGHTGDLHSSSRVTSGDRDIEEPILSVMLFVQPCVWREVLENKEADGRGLLTRILPVQVSCPMPLDDGELREMKPELEQAWEALIERILELRLEIEGKGTPRKVRCSPGAHGVLRELYNQSAEWANGPLADLRGELGRWRENAARLALVLAVAENPECDELDEETARRAVALLTWIGGRGFEIRNEAREKNLEERAQKLASNLKTKGNELPLRILGKNHSFSQEEVQQLALHFKTQFKIEERKNQAGGRTSLVCLLLKP